MNSDPAYRLDPATWAQDRRDLMHVRRAVFIEEQQVPEDEEWDAADPLCIHVLARTPNRDAVGTGRLDPAGKIGRLAVLAGHRGNGLGDMLLRWLIDAAARRGLREVYLHAQTQALPFYRRLGFMAEGAVFDEVGIPHQRMRLELRTNDRPREEIQRHGQPYDPHHA